MNISVRKILNFLFMDLLLSILSKKFCGRYAFKICTMEFSFLLSITLHSYFIILEVGGVSVSCHGDYL